MSAAGWQSLDEAALADLLFGVLDAHADSMAVKRTRFRLRDMGADNHDELAQFRLLQRACREDAALSGAFEAAGLPALADLRLLPATPVVGRLVQAFNRMVEARWEVH